MSTIPKSTTVQLNVGGTPYKISLSLIKTFPDSMLASIVSDKWKGGSEEKIFIEGDGQKFRYVLDYMRDGEVTLPKEEFVASFFTELEYFGIEYDLTKISSKASLKALEYNDFYKFYLKSFETSKQFICKDYVETLITIDIINNALSGNLEFELLYSDYGDTESKLICEFFRNESNATRNDIVLNVNKHIHGLNLRIVTHHFVRNYHSLSMNVKASK